MNALLRILLPVTLVVGASAAQAESLQCNGQSASEGDSRLSVLYKCGPPLLADNYCAPVFYPRSIHAIPDPFAGYVAPCQQVEEWLYDRGPGNFIVTVRFRGGIVTSIRYGDPSAWHHGF
jgi:hypothetical protein